MKSLDDFTEEVREALKKFEADYRSHHAKQPTMYPLEIEDNNAGVWFEFFSDFLNSK